VGLVGHSAGQRSGVRSTLSREQCICPTLLTTIKRFLYVDHARYVWLRVIHRPSVECMWCVDRVSPVGCTLIRISVTLGYGIMFLNGLMACFTIITCIATLVCLSSGLSGLKFN
jgi:hypothetical protein